MALILLGKSPCAICGQPLRRGESIFATSGVFTLDEELFPFCDAGMHWSCYADWPLRDAFARTYFEAQVKGFRRNPYWEPVLLTDLVYVVLNPSKPVEKVRLCFRRTGGSLDVPLGQWETWLVSPAQWADDLHELERATVVEVLPVLRERLPTSEALLCSIDWEKRRERLDAIEHQQREQDAARRKELEAYNAACRRIAAVIAIRGLHCPHCRNHSRDYTFLADRGSYSKACFICRSCARSIHLGDWSEMEVGPSAPTMPDETSGP